MQIAFLMELLEPNDDLCKDFSCFLKSEHSIFKFGLIVYQISTITILQNKENILLILSHIIQLDNIRWIHCLHALNLTIQILPEMRLVLNHLHWDQLQCQQLPLLILHQVNVTVCTFAQSTLVLILVQEHQRYYNKVYLGLYINKTISNLLTLSNH